MTSIIKWAFSLFFLSLPILLISQNANPSIKGRIDPVIGGNYSKIYYQDSKHNALVRPFGGVSGEVILKGKLELGASVLFSNKASRIDYSYIIKQTGFDLLISPVYHLGDFLFKAGLAFENAISTTIDNQNNAPTIAYDFEPYSQINYFLGIEFKLNNRLNFLINQIIPSHSLLNNSNTMIGVRYRLNQSGTKTPSYRKIKRNSAEKHIKELKGGVLLVRLHTSEPTIEALKKFGENDKAEKVRIKQEEFNLNLLDAFRKYYSFSDIRFFFSSYSNQVVKGNFNGIFLNENLEVDSSIFIPKNKKVFTAEFATIEQDTMQLFSHVENIAVAPFQQKEIERYYGSPNLGVKAIVIKTQDFKQLSRPFPYYSRYLGRSIEQHPEILGMTGLIFTYMFTTPRIDACIQRLNFNLNRFYNLQ